MKTTAHTSPNGATLQLPQLDETKNYWCIQSNGDIVKLELREYPKTVKRFKKRTTKNLFGKTKLADKKIKTKVIDSAIIGFDNRINNLKAITTIAQNMYEKAYPKAQPENRNYFGQYKVSK